MKTQKDLSAWFEIALLHVLVQQKYPYKPYGGAE